MLASRSDARVPFDLSRLASRARPRRAAGSSSRRRRLCVGIAWTVRSRGSKRERAPRATSRHAHLRASCGPRSSSRSRALLLLVSRAGSCSVRLGSAPHLHRRRDAAADRARRDPHGRLRDAQPLRERRTWLKTGERAIVVLDLGRRDPRYFIGVLPDVARELDAIAHADRQVARCRCCTLAERRRRGDPHADRDARGCQASSSIGCCRRTALDNNSQAVLAKFVRAVLLVVRRPDRASGDRLRPHASHRSSAAPGRRASASACRSSPPTTSPGFTILLDKSIRLGDMIIVDDRYGAGVAGDVALRGRAEPRRRSRRSCRTKRWSRRRCSTTPYASREVRSG